MKTTPPALRKVAASKKARAREKKMKAVRAISMEEIQAFTESQMNAPARPGEEYHGYASRYGNVSRGGEERQE
jgi:hypothetical protein